jgi:hypothetical protein
MLAPGFGFQASARKSYTAETAERVREVNVALRASIAMAGKAYSY